jgi:hypothetical protein
VLDIQRSVEMACRREEDVQIANFRRQHDADKSELFEKVKVEYKRRLDELTARYATTSDQVC